MVDMVRFLAKRLSTRPDLDPADAKATWQRFRVDMGWAKNAPLLSPPSANMKLRKNGTYPSYGLSLAPSDASGRNVCRFSTPECRRGCVAYAGNGLYPKVGQARQLKVAFLHAFPQHFMALLAHEIDWLDPKYHVRLNTFSDIPWERVAPWLIAEPGGYYDYTAWPDRHSTDLYNLTFSCKETTSEKKIHAMMERMNVAVVMDTPRTGVLPETYLGYTVVDGDKSDARWLDPRPAIVGLRAKGRMRGGTWNMVKMSNSPGRLVSSTGRVG